MPTLAALVTVFLACCTCRGHALGQTQKRTARKRRELIPEVGPAEDSVFEAGLTEQTLHAAALYENAHTWYAPGVHARRLKGPVLGYITPWNRLGYDWAVRFRAKLTHVAPVWYQLKVQAGQGTDRQWALEGHHEHNTTWLDAVRQPAGQAGSVVKVVPRVIVELQDPQDHVLLVSQPAGPVQLLTQLVQNQGYDGIVLEVWMTWVLMNAVNNPQFYQAALGFIQALESSLRALQLPGELILAVPPAVPSSYSRPFIDAQHLQDFSPHVTHWSLMTYDYAMSSGPQPNAPLPWLDLQSKALLGHADGQKVCSNRSQLLMGVAFYGYDYGPLHDPEAQPKAVVLDEVLELLARQQPTLHWHSEHGEHWFDYNGLDGKHRVYFPSPRSLELRLEKFTREGMGVSIWELGQGIERFFDLL